MSEESAKKMARQIDGLVMDVVSSVLSRLPGWPPKAKKIVFESLMRRFAALANEMARQI